MYVHLCVYLCDHVNISAVCWQYFSGTGLSRSVFRCSRRVQSNICKSTHFLLFPLSCSALIHLKTGNIWRLAASPKRGLCTSHKQTNMRLTHSNHKCYQAVSWLWTCRGYVLISCNLFEMLVKGVKCRGG